jgi:hypothetical protein
VLANAAQHRDHAVLAAGLPGKAGGTHGARAVLVSAHQHHMSLAPAAGSTHQGTRAPAIGRLAALVGDLVTQLDSPQARDPLHAVVAECNAALEGCLEAQREGREREEATAGARDELERLAARLVTVVDCAELFAIMRQIRRVLGRFDVCGL